MYDTLFTAFMDTLNREGKSINDYQNNTPYNVIFRKNKDTNSFQDRVTIFYPVLSDIHAGQLLSYSNKIYLAINKETAENGIYYKSDLLKTNAVIHTIINSKEINMPVYAYDIADGLTQKNNVMSLISGNIHIIAEPNSTIKSLSIDNEFDAVGRHWKIDNIISKDNVIHLYCEVWATTSHTYTVTITANDSYHRGESAQLTAVAKQDDTIVNNISFIWTSSDTSLATVDNTGLVKFLADGNVTITATWTSQNVSGTKAITITEPDSYSLSITANDSYTTADTPTLTATAQKNGTTDSTATITWISSDTSIATIDSTGKATFLKAGNVTFTATWIQQNVTATKSITVTQAVSGSCVVKANNGNTISTVQTIHYGYGSKYYYNAVFQDGSGNEVTGVTPAWTLINLNKITSSDITMSTVSGYPLRIGISLKNNSSIAGATFTLHLASTTGTYGSYDVNCKVAF
ncbi:Ig-like domain-containing protein [Caproicibacterium sp. BJN0003]|uniref:Ig-like domain-containing protein n=1 Tax=Caproicibacterium sp. BJN0003 TaxID=2994078 RepID=UPI00225BECCB|nr:Ig-like domain-containing protein [Caproicibacterium sp. BJN0003]UZT83194.1 Ig-like domain-containing protein [Caproicibacterium sp. BJN0003]